MKNETLFRRVRALRLPSGRYALFGSAQLGIRNLKECHDIDVIVDDALWDEYRAKGWKVKEGPRGSVYLEEEHIELWKDWGPGEWNIVQLIREAETIEGLPFVRIEEVVKWKKVNAREKDLKDVETLEKSGVWPNC